jgi:hypothetical protein
VKSDKESVTEVTVVTPYRGVYPLKNVDDFSLKNDIYVLNILKNSRTSTQCSILERCDEGKGGRYTVPYTVTSVTSVTKFLKCPECNFKNIYPETVEHHMKYKHGQDDRQGAN